VLFKSTKRMLDGAHATVNSLCELIEGGLVVDGFTDQNGCTPCSGCHVKYLSNVQERVRHFDQMGSSMMITSHP